VLQNPHLKLSDGQDLVVECWPNGTPIILLPYWVTLGWKRYIGVELVSRPA
jgi:hypothetical protein